MNSKRPLAPGFINTLDNYLLKNKPVTWTCRTHLVIYYSLLFSIVLAVLCFIVPSDPREDSFSFVWTTLAIICAIIALVVYCIYLFRFNVFKRFGIDKPWNGLKVFFFFFISISFFVLPCFIPAGVESARANMAYKDKEVVDDVNAINIKINQLYFDSLNHKWKEETYVVRDSVPYYTPASPNADTVYMPDETDEDVTVPASSSNGMNNKIVVIDTSSLARMMRNKDSLVKINDSVYKFFTCPDYVFLNQRNYYGFNFSIFGTNDHDDEGFYSSKDIFYKHIQNFKREDRLKTEKELKALLTKYETSGYGPYAVADEDKYSLYSRIQQRYNLASIGSNISNVLDKKFRWRSNNDSRVQMWFYITLIVTLLLFIFRHSTAKTFLITLLAGFLLFILTTVFLAFTGGRGITYTGVNLFYYLAFAVLAFVGKINKTRTLISGIALNLFAFFTFFVPTLFLSFIYEVLPSEYTNAQSKSHWAENQTLYFDIAQITGIVLLFILIEPLFKKLYRNWYSKPEE